MASNFKCPMPGRNWTHFLLAHTSQTSLLSYRPHTSSNESQHSARKECALVPFSHHMGYKILTTHRCDYDPLKMFLSRPDASRGNYSLARCPSLDSVASLMSPDLRGSETEQKSESERTLIWLIKANVPYFCEFHKNMWPCEPIARAPQGTWRESMQMRGPTLALS